jgi:glycosyltransferase involved in cell wall biosynthesis
VKIAVISPHFNTPRANAASSIGVMQYIVEMLSEKHEVVVYTANGKSANKKKYSVINVNNKSVSKNSAQSLKYIPTISDYFSPLFVFSVAKIIKNTRPDIIFTGGTSFSSFIGFVVKRISNIALVHYVFEFTDKWKWWKGDTKSMGEYSLNVSYILLQLLQTAPREILRRRFLQKLSLKNVDQLIASSFMVKSKINRLLEAEQCVEVVYPPVAELTNYSGFNSTQNKSRRIVYFGHLWQGRGVLDLLNAFVSVKSDIRYEDVKLIIAASNVHQVTEEYFLEIAKNANIMNHIEVHGVVNNIYEDIIKDADLVCLPYRDTPSIKMLEILSSRKPLITTNIQWTTEILKHNSNSLLYKPGDVQSLENCIKKILDDKELSNKLVTNARNTFDELISFNVNIKKIDKIISNVVKK